MIMICAGLQTLWTQAAIIDSIRAAAVDQAATAVAVAAPVEGSWMGSETENKMIRY